MLTINDDCFFWNDEERERIQESRAGGYQVQNNNGDCFPDFKHIVFESEDVARRLLVTAICVTKQNDWRRVFISLEEISEDSKLLVRL